MNIQNIFRTTALHKAASRGSFAISELLLASGAQTSITDNTGMTPLDYALDNSHHDVCQLLLMNIDSSPLPTAITDTIPLTGFSLGFRSQMDTYHNECTEGVDASG